MDKMFSELAVGATFKYNGMDYKKVDRVRISCCQSVNAVAVDNPSNRIFVNDTSTVVVNA